MFLRKDHRNHLVVRADHLIVVVEHQHHQHYLMSSLVDSCVSLKGIDLFLNLGASHHVEDVVLGEER